MYAFAYIVRLHWHTLANIVSVILPSKILSSELLSDNNMCTTNPAYHLVLVLVTFDLNILDSRHIVLCKPPNSYLALMREQNNKGEGYLIKGQ